MSKNKNKKEIRKNIDRIFMKGEFTINEIEKKEFNSIASAACVVCECDPCDCD